MVKYFRIVSILLILTLFSIVFIGGAYAEGGHGTADDPYIIQTATELQSMQNNLSAYYKLGNDINLSGFSWNPISNSISSPFSGSFDGNGFTIYNLNVNHSAYASMFGCTHNATIKNVRFTNPTIYQSYASVGSSEMGGASVISNIETLVSGSQTTITNCVIDNATITTESTYVNSAYRLSIAGFVNIGSFNISNCYISSSTLRKSGSYSVALSNCWCGGIQSRIADIFTSDVSTPSIITNCYVENMTIDSSLSIAGGIGLTFTTMVSSSISNSVYLGNIVSQGSEILQIRGGTSHTNLKLINNYAVNGGTSTTSRDGLNVTSTQYNSQSWWENTVGYDFTNTWSWDSGRNLPVLKIFEEGHTPEHPYIITTATELQSMQNDLSAYYKLGNDIDMSTYFATWQPIGSTSAPFIGQLDGDGYTITHMNKMFIFAGTNSVIKNVKFDNSGTTITDSATLIYSINSTITTCDFENINITSSTVSPLNTCSTTIILGNNLTISDCIFNNIYLYEETTGSSLTSSSFSTPIYITQKK